MDRPRQDHITRGSEGNTKISGNGVADTTASGPKLAKKHAALTLRIVVIIISVGISLLVAELGLRLVGVKPARIEYGDLTLGISPPKSAVWRASLPDNGPAYVSRTNNLSFFEDHETPLAKSPGIRRIVIVGDSQTACQCPNVDSYPHLLQAKLNGGGETKYEVLNAGVGKYSPYQYYVRAKEDAISLEPDQIIVGFYIGNDFLDLIRQDDRPYLTLNADGSFTEHPPVFLVYANPADRGGWLKSSRVYSVLRAGFGPTLLYELTRSRMLVHDVHSVGYGALDAMSYMLAVRKLSRVSVNFMTQIIHQQLWFERFPGTLETARILNRHVMQTFADLCRRNKIRLTYVLLPTKIDIEPDDLKELTSQVSRIDKNLTVETIQKFNNVMAEEVLREGKELGVQVINLRPYLLSKKHSDHLYFNQDMHLTAYGNSLVADALASALFPERSADFAVGQIPGLQKSASPKSRAGRRVN